MKCRIAAYLSALVLALPPAWGAEMETLAIAVANNGSVAEVIREPGYVLRISAVGRKPIEIPLRQLTEVSDISPSPKLAWSSDAGYVSIRYDAGEESRVAEVFSVGTRSRVWSGQVTEVAWGLSQSLLVVPMYPLDEMQATRGLIVVDAGSKKSRKMGGGYFFSGEMHSSPPFVVARADKVVGGARVNCVVSIDLRNDDISEVSCHK